MWNLVFRLFLGKIVLLGPSWAQIALLYSAEYLVPGRQVSAASVGITDLTCAEAPVLNRTDSHDEQVSGIFGYRLGFMFREPLRGGEPFITTMRMNGREQ